MINVMFWNANIRNHENVDEDKCINIDNVIAAIALEYNCDIIVLAEYDLDVRNICKKLEANDIFFSSRDVIGNTHIKIIARNFLKSEIIRDSSRYAIYDFEWGNVHFMLAGVHFPSKLHDEDRQELIGRQLVDDILDSEKRLKHNNTIIVGDFNANPFENAMISFGYMHAIYDSEIVEKKKVRKCCDMTRQFLYNPMWNLFGDDNLPKGSYYCDTGGVKNLYWNIFDQVLISPNVVKSYIRESMKIITSIKDYKLLDREGIPDKVSYSDHLPLFFSFEENLL